MAAVVVVRNALAKSALCWALILMNCVEKEEKIMEMLVKLYLQASHNHDERFGSFATENCLVMNEDGMLTIKSVVPTGTRNIHMGFTIRIAIAEDFDMWEGEDERGWIQEELGSKFSAFEEFVNNEENEEVEYCCNLNTLKAYDEMAYKKILETMKLRTEFEAPNWAEGNYRLTKQKLLANSELL